MKEIPILFSTPMVKAIIEGRKTMTRRAVKTPRYKEAIGFRICSTLDGRYKWPEAIDQHERSLSGNGCNMGCPYGEPGDVLWVREEHYRFGHWEKNGVTKTGKQKWRFLAVPGSDIFFNGDKLPESAHKSKVKGKEDLNLLYKRLARFMPKSAARIWLEVTDVRVERLHEITWDDAVAEGCPGYRPTQDEPTDQFRRLWQSINGEESWDSNPWVWVVSFKVISTTGKPSLPEVNDHLNQTS